MTGTIIGATLQGSTSVLTPLVDAATAATALNIGTTNANQINLNQNTQITGNVTFANGANRSISVATASSGAGNKLTILGASGAANSNGGDIQIQAGSTGGGAVGTPTAGNLTFLGGTANSTNGNGGNITFTAGAKAGTGSSGFIIFKPAASNDNTTAVQLQNAAGTALVNLDTTGSGTLTVSSALTATLGATISGAAISLNDSSSFNTNINSTTGTANVNIGNSSNAGNTVTITAGATNGIALNSSKIDSNAATLNLFNTPTTISALQAATSISLGATTGTLTVRNANTTIGNAAGSGVFTNNGATLNTTLQIANLATGGAIGTAAATVDIYTSFAVLQTTANQTITIPTPTTNPTTVFGRIIYVSNIGTTAFTLGGTTLNPGTTATLIWSNTDGVATGGESWQFAGADGNGILNQNSTDQSANFRITGSGQANTSFLAPAFERASAGTLSVGTTANTTSLTVGSSSLTGTLTIDSGAGSTANIFTSANARTINIATGGAAQTVTIGSTNTTSTLNLQAGTGNANGDINIGDSAVAGKIIDIGSVTNAATTTVRIATAAAAQSVSIGSSNTTSSLNLQAGSGNATLNATAGNLTLSTTTSGTLAVTSAGALNLTGAANSTINYGANTLAVTSSAFNVTATGALTLGSGTGTGALINNGTTLNTEKTYTNFATGGAIDTAANSVDKYTYFSILQTTAGQTITIPTPTTNPTTVFGRIIYVSNIGTTAFTLGGTTLNPGTTATLIWSNTDGVATGGESWQFAGADGNGILNQSTTDQNASFRISGTGSINGTSTTAFRVQSASSADTMFTVDTSVPAGGATGNRIKIGNSTVCVRVLQLCRTTITPSRNVSTGSVVALFVTLHGVLGGVIVHRTVVS
jgi:hypothetical protein